MLRLELPAVELWDEARQEFSYGEAATLSLEHSLVSVSKWEARWGKIFFTDEPKTDEEARDYVGCMSLDGDIPNDVLERLGPAEFQAVNAYIANPMTATRITSKRPPKRSGEQPSSELVYYWMIALGIPMECQHWHLNRLLTLIEVCNVKGGPPEKLSQREVLEQQAALNEMRKKKLNTKG